MTVKMGTFGLEKTAFSKLLKTNAYLVPLKVCGVLLAYLACSFGTVLLSGSFWVLVPCLLMGFILAGFANAAHECIHGTHLRGRKYNRFAGMLWCTPLLINFSTYRYQHLNHHRLTGLEGDTEPSVTFIQLKDYVAAMVGIRYWRHLFERGVKVVREEFAISIDTESKKAQVIFDHRIISLWICSVFTFTWLFPKLMIFCYWVPLLLYPTMLFIFSLPEHYACEKNDSLLKNTRTVISNRFVRFFMWNGNYHAEHHAYPAVPGANLPSLHREIGDKFHHKAESYLVFHLNILRKLWARHEN